MCKCTVITEEYSGFRGQWCVLRGTLRICLSLSVLIGHGWKGRERIAQWEEQENFRIGLQEKVECHDQNVWVSEAI